MRNRSYKEIALLLVLIFLMVMSLNLAVLDSTGMDISISRLALYSFAATAAAMAAVSFPVVMLLYIGVIAAGGYMVYYNHPEMIKGIGTMLYDFFSWLPGYVTGSNTFEEKYSLVFALLYIIVSVLIITVLASWKRGSMLLIIFGAAAITFFWFIYVEKARFYLMMYLFAAITLHSYRVLKSNMAKWERENCKTSPNIERHWLINSTAVIAVSIALASALPANIDPLKWNWLNDKVISAFPFLIEWRNDTMESYDYGFGSRYGISQVGYRSKKLGGPVNLDKSVMFSVMSNGTEALYLRGTVKEKYTGSAWQKVNKKYNTIKTGDQISLSGWEDSIEGRPEKLIITPRKLLTSTVLSPYKITKVLYNSNRIFIDADSEVYLPKLVTKTETYTVESSIPYIDEAKLRKAGAKKGMEYSYLALPDSMTYRTKLLVDKVTEGCKNDYDKAKAIESYLRTNYKYNLKPQQPPSNREFVDYFLFEGKEGYCTYFATAMAVMLRQAGIPCRYVEGFILKENGSSNRNVTGEEAHAWVEACFNEYGWVTFEATPAYPVVQHVKPKEVVETAVAPAAEDKRAEIAVTSTARRNRDLDIEDEGATKGTTPKNKPKMHIGLIIWALLGLAALRVAYLAFRKMLLEAEMKNSKDRKYAIEYIKDIFWHISKMGLKQEGDDTFREYMDKAGQYFKGNLGDASRVTDIIEKARYSKEGISEAEKGEAEAFRSMVKKLAGYRVGTVRLYFSQYFIGK